MPITREEFELGMDAEREWIRLIHGFLTEHKDEAFTSRELWEGMVAEKSVPFHAMGHPIDGPLERLVEMGAAQRRRFRGEDYYLYANPLSL